MSDMIERVAEAMAQKRREKINMPLASLWEDLARAAILSMRDPTDAMAEAGQWPAQDFGAPEAWRAMIEEALK